MHNNCVSGQVKHLIGKQYEPLGRGPAKYDCWGLAIEAVKIITGKVIPDYKMDPAQATANAELMKIASSNGTWKRIPEKEIVPGLVVALQLLRPGSITHAGVTLGGGVFLQASEKRGVTIEKISKYQKLIEGYYEYTK